MPKYGVPPFPHPERLQNGTAQEALSPHGPLRLADEIPVRLKDGSTVPRWQAIIPEARPQHPSGWELEQQASSSNEFGQVGRYAAAGLALAAAALIVREVRK